MKLLTVVFLVSVAFSQSARDCVVGSISIEQAIEVARKHIGEPFKVWMTLFKEDRLLYVEG